MYFLYSSYMLYSLNLGGHCSVRVSATRFVVLSSFISSPRPKLHVHAMPKPQYLLETS